MAKAFRKKVRKRLSEKKRRGSQMDPHLTFGDGDFFHPRLEK
jgi:hypothetical protein